MAEVNAIRLAELTIRWRHFRRPLGQELVSRLNGTVCATKIPRGRTVKLPKVPHKMAYVAHPHESGDLLHAELRINQKLARLLVTKCANVLCRDGSRVFAK